jgi:hypothetical protein
LLRGDRTGCREVPPGCRDDTTLTEHGFEEDGCCPGPDRRPKSGLVAVRDERDPARERLERRPLRRLAGERQRPHRPAVERALGGDDRRAAGATGQLERRLVGLRAGVAEEHPPVSTGQVEQSLGEPGGGLVRHQVGHVPERGDLPADRLDHGGVGMTEHVDRDPADQVDVVPAEVVPHVCALAAHQREGRWRVGRHDGVRPAVEEVAA